MERWLTGSGGGGGGGSLITCEKMLCETVTWPQTQVTSYTQYRRACQIVTSLQINPPIFQLKSLKFSLHRKSIALGSQIIRALEDVPWEATKADIKAKWGDDLLQCSKAARTTTWTTEPTAGTAPAAWSGGSSRQTTENRQTMNRNNYDNSQTNKSCQIVNILILSIKWGIN